MTGDAIKLYSYWRSSACYRVRIALNLKGLVFETLPVHLLRDRGQQHAAAFREVNPQQMIPVLMHGGRALRQSLSIMEYLDETWGNKPLLPSVARERQRARAIAQIIACDIHPLGNLRVLQYLEQELGATAEQRENWSRRWVQSGLEVVERELTDNPATGSFCEGESPTIADCCLVPQAYNATRIGVDLAGYPQIARINALCLAMPEFAAARPEMQPDATSPT